MSLENGSFDFYTPRRVAPAKSEEEFLASCNRDNGDEFDFYIPRRVVIAKRYDDLGLVQYLQDGALKTVFAEDFDAVFCRGWPFTRDQYPQVQDAIEREVMDIKQRKEKEKFISLLAAGLKDIQNGGEK